MVWEGSPQIEDMGEVALGGGLLSKTEAGGRTVYCAW